MKEDDIVGLNELFSTGLTGQKSINALRTRASEGFLVVGGMVLFSNHKLYNLSLSIIRLQAARILKDMYPRLSWRRLSIYFHDLNIDQTLIDNILSDQEKMDKLISAIVNMLAKELYNDSELNNLINPFAKKNVYNIDGDFIGRRRQFRPLLVQKVNMDYNDCSAFKINLTVSTNTGDAEDIGSFNDYQYTKSANQANATPNEEHLFIILQGIDVWNSWRNKTSIKEPNLSGANLSYKDLSRANLKDVNLMGADLSYTDLRYADLRNAKLSETNLTATDLMSTRLNRADLRESFLRGANLSGADLREVDLSGANLRETSLLHANLCKAVLCSADLNSAILHGSELRGANLRDARLRWADISYADFTGGDLIGADLSYSVIVKTNFENAKLTNCRIFGISAWDVAFNEETVQNDLIITPISQSSVTVDNIEVAQFIYLLISNEKIRNVIDTVAKKAVLILGRFIKERKEVLDAIRCKLRQLGFIPILFNFEKPTQRDFTETIRTLAGLSLFIIADITNPMSSPLELQATVPNYMIPFVPICNDKEEPFSMFKDLSNMYSEWVLDILKYDSVDNLIALIDDAIIKPALCRHEQLMRKKNEPLRIRHIMDYAK